MSWGNFFRELLISSVVYTILFVGCLLLPIIALVLLFHSNFPTDALGTELIYSTLFGLLVALPVSLLVGSSKDGRRKNWMASASIGIFLTVALILMLIRNHLPDSGWNKLPSPPTSLTRLVQISPIGALGGDVYAAARDGQTFGFFCFMSDNCEWRAVDTPPTPSDPSSYWSGTCGKERQQALLWLEPPPPATPQDRAINHYCGPDYQVETHFLLTVDGNVWSLQKFDGMGERIVGVLRFPMGLISILIASFWARREFAAL